MSLTVHQLRSLVDRLQASVIGNTLHHIAMLDSYRLLLCWNAPEEHPPLLACWEKHLHRLHQTQRYVAPKKQPPNKGLEATLNEALATSTLSKVALINDDRIVALTFDTRSGPRDLVLQLIPGQAGVCLLNGTKVLATTNPKSPPTYTPPPGGHPPPQEESLPCDAIDACYRKKEDEQVLETRRSEFTHGLAAKLKKLKREHHKLQKQLQTYSQWPKKQHEGQLLQANFHRLRRGLDTIALEDWEQSQEALEITLDPKLSPQDQVESFFKTSRKWRRGIAPTEERLGNTEQAIATHTQLLDRLHNATTLTEIADIAATSGIKQQGKVSAQPQKPATRRPYRDYHTAAGWTILVGRSASDNDTLTFTVANGNDYWLHVADYPGSHVILRPPKKGMDPDQETLHDAALVAMRYSKAKERGTAEVHITQKKHVRRPPRGRPGQVFIANYRAIGVDDDSDRWDQLRKREGKML